MVFDFVQHKSYRGDYRGEREVESKQNLLCKPLGRCNVVVGFYFQL